MKYIFKFSILFFTIIIFSCGDNKNKTNNENENQLVDDYSAKIDSLILTTNPRKFNGVILITQNGETKYSKEYGFSDFEKKIPINLNDNFRIQSNSKQITAVLILKEVEKGHIDLNKPINEYLPELKQTWTDSVTVHQLLNMSSGIVDIEKRLIFEPGKGYRYSNPGYGLLGSILENVTGKEFNESANQLFKELGMKNTYCYQFDKPNTGLVNGHSLENGKVNIVEFDSIGFTKESWKDFIPAGGIISNVYDLNIWETKLHNGKILSSGIYKQMITPSNRGPHAAFANDTIGYAYGLRIHDQHSTKHLGHGGRGIGFVSIKFYIPETDVDVIIWENIYAMDGDWRGGNLVYHFENKIREIVVNSNLGK
ncbi:MAG: beta-lactamase family protein [Saprospiraceae bacterium]|nr:beta-lactamase family protein [Saprospiraceae bacterium]